MNESSFLLNDYRCKCGKLLLKGIFFDGNLEIKCKRCGQINKIGAIKLIDDATHYFLIIDNLGFITNTSESASRILGYPQNELLGKNITQINANVPKEIGIKFFGSESLLDNDNSLRLDTIHLTKDGKKIPVFILLKLYSPEGKGEYILEYVSLKNINNKSNSLKVSSNQYLENACDYYFDIDKKGVQEYISPQMEKIFGFTQEKVLGKNYFDFLPVATIIKEKNTFTHFSDKDQSYRIVQDVGLDIKNKPIYSDLFFTTKFNEVGKFIGYRVLGWLTEKPSL